MANVKAGPVHGMGQECMSEAIYQSIGEDEDGESTGKR
jgi:hypothetical protein